LDTSTIVEASITPREVEDSGKIATPGCFKISDGDDKWIMCADSQDDADKWICKLTEITGGPKCDLTTTAGVDVKEVEEVLQPLIIIPLPSPNCATDWNYNEHGADWKCRCNEGRE
jgi:hypothetical protein